MENQPALPRTPLEEASDPATDGERLRQLSGWRGAVGRAVASNPNSPTFVLVWIAKRYWKEVMENPVFPLLLLEDPGLPLKLPVKALREVLREWNPPGEFLHPLKRHPDAEIREAARLHVANGAAPGDAAVPPLIELKGGDSLAELVEMGAAPGWLLGQALECDSAKIRARALVVICKGPDKTLHARVNLLRAAGSGGWLRAVGKGNKDLDGESLGALAASLRNVFPSAKPSGCLLEGETAAECRGRITMARTRWWRDRKERGPYCPLFGGRKEEKGEGMSPLLSGGAGLAGRRRGDLAARRMARG